MKFGLFVATDFPHGTRVSEQVPKLVEQVQVARTMGFDAIFALQHYLGAMPTLQPLHILCRLAAEAGNMRLGSNIFILPLHHPVEVAEAYATLDHITGGRTIAGLGMGYRENEFESFGIPMDDRVGRYTEGVEVIRGLWKGTPLSYEGKHFNIKDQTISLPPVQPGGPPIWVGAGVHRTGARRAAALGDSWILMPQTPAEKVPGILTMYKKELQAQGKSLDRDYVLRREVCLHEDPAVAKREGQISWGRQAKAYAQHNLPDTSGLFDYLHSSQFDDKADDIVDDAFLFGTPEQAVTKLKAIEAMGINYVMIKTQWYDLPHESAMRSIRLFGEQVMPHFR